MLCLFYLNNKKMNNNITNNPFFKLLELIKCSSIEYLKLKKIATLKTKECDLLNERINNLRKKEQSIRLEISNIKKSIELENKHLIGKKAICSNADDPTFNNIECVCSYVHCTDSFDVAPKFTHKGKKVLVDYYKWL